jgi:hypothetical protein
MAVLTQSCPNGHQRSVSCYAIASALVICPKCERERKEAEKKAQKALEDQERRDSQMQKHLLEIAKVQREIDEIMQTMNTARLSLEQDNVLAQKRKDLTALKEMASKPRKPSSEAKASQRPDNIPHSANEAIKAVQSNHSRQSNEKETLRVHLQIAIDHNSSSAQTEWQRQKDQENQSNPAIDQIMEMIGLEDVKSQVLKIKSKVETSIRQGTDLKKERLGLTLLGNPGTGMLLKYGCNETNSTALESYKSFEYC